MKLKLVLLLSLSFIVFSCNATVDNSGKIKSLEDKIDNLSQSLSDMGNGVSKSSNDGDSKKINARLTSLESSLKKLEKSFANLSKNQKNDKKQPSKPSGPWKRDYTYKTSVGDSYYQGPKDAKVVITEWSDYYWPYCRKAVSLMDDIMKKYEGKVQFVMKNAPRGNLEESNTKYTAALWATAAGEQGKYFEMSHKMFDNFSELRKNSDLPIQLAAELGLDTEQLKNDFNSEKVRNLVAKEKAEFSSLRSQGMDRLGIPKFLINGKEPSSRSVESWSAIIDDLLKK